MIASWCRPGQMVVCIDPWEWFSQECRRLPGLHERDVYVVAKVIEVTEAEVSPVLFRLAELPPPASLYPAQRFRPIATPSIAAIVASALPVSP